MLNKLYSSLILYLSNLSQYRSFMVSMNIQFINTYLSVYIYIYLKVYQIKNAIVQVIILY